MATTATRTVSEQMYTFDDIERYTYCHYQGKPGWVMDKGGHISQVNGRHLLIEHTNDADGTPESLLAETLVNKYLREKRSLWIDFGNELIEEAHS